MSLFGCSSQGYFLHFRCISHSFSVHGCGTAYSRFWKLELHLQQMEQDWTVGVNFFKPGCLAVIVKTRQMTRRAWQGAGLSLGIRNPFLDFFSSCFVHAFLETRILPWNKTSLYAFMTLRDYLPISSIKISLLDIG